MLKALLHPAHALTGASGLHRWTTACSAISRQASGECRVSLELDIQCLFLIPSFRATGITTAVVEAMEGSFKKDILRELQVGKGRLLLHDEVEERPGVFSIIPVWEDVSEEDILTPRDVFEVVQKEGYRVSPVIDRTPFYA